MRKLLLLLSFTIATFVTYGQVIVSGSSGGDGTYTTLSGAFTAIATSTGTITITISGNTTEPATGATLVGGPWTSITIAPSGGPWTISGAATAGSPLINFNGADNVTINGGGNLIFSNTTVSATSGTSTFKLVGDATNNTFNGVTFLGSATGTAGSNTANVWISTGTTTGNDNNNFQNCKFGPVGTNYPSQCVIANGSTTSEAIQNSNITFNNCEFYDYFLATGNHAGMYVSTGNTQWTITNNKIYQSVSRTITTVSTVYGIYCVNTGTPATGTNFIITGNTIGYANNAGTGTTTYASGTTAGGFTGILFNATNTVVNTHNINNNTIANIQWTSTAASAFNGISTTSVASSTTGFVLNLNNNQVKYINWVNATGQITGILCGYSPNVSLSNNNINNISKNATTGAFYGIQYLGNATSSHTFNNNTISNLSNTAISGTAAMYGIYTASSPATEIFTNNTIDGITSASTSGQTLTGIYNLSATTGNKTFQANTVKNITLPNASTGNIYGIRASYMGASNIISGNKVFNLSGGATIYGILAGSTFATSAVVNVYQNKVYDLTTNNPTGITYGIAASSSTSTITNMYNNVIGNLKALATSSATDAIRGIYLSGTGTTSNYNIYYNTVYLDGLASSGTDFATSAIYHTYSATATTAALTMKNNIFVNSYPSKGAGISAVFKRSAATDLNNYSTASNYNLFYGTNIYNNTTNTDATISAFKVRVATREGSSFSENPPFNSVTGADPDFLNIDVSTPTQICDGGTPIVGITTDFNGDVRDGTTPDIGAYEFDGIPADLTSPNIVYTPLIVKNICTTNPSISATITDASGVNTTAGTKPRLWFKKSTEANAFPATNTSADDGWKWVEASNASSPFNFTFDYSLLTSAVITGDSISYFIIAQDVQVIPNVGAITATFAATPTSVALGAGAFPATGAINGFTIIPEPGAILATSNKSDLCVHGTVTLSSVSELRGAELQWQSSPASANTWSDIAGATYTPFTTADFSSSTDFRLVVKCGGTPIAASPSNTVTVTVNNPSITSTTPATRCGTGTVNLSATSASPAIKWYANPTGGSPLYTGGTFTTPVLNSSTTYYVAASAGGSTSDYSKLTYEVGSSATNLTTYGQVFTITEQIVLNSVQVYSTTGTAITISLYNSTGVTQLQTTGSVPVVAASSPIIPLGWTIPPGTYRLAANGMTGSFYRDNSNTTYPIALGTFGQIDGFHSSLTGAVNVTASYYFMYRWNITTACDGGRTAVTATVNTPPAIAAAVTEDTVCNGTSTDLSVTSGNAGYAYTWTPGNHAGATYNVSPSSTTKYYVNALDGSGGPYDGCANIDSVTVTVINPIPISIASSRNSVCQSDGSTAKMYVDFLAESTVYYEDFETGAIGWTKTNTTTGGTPANAAWTIYPSPTTLSSQSVSSNDASHFYHTSSDAAGSGSQTNTTLTSPAINTNGYSSLTLEFYHYYRHLTAPAAFVKVSTDGIGWTTVYTSPNATVGSASSFSKQTINLNAYINQTTLYIQFAYITTGWWYGWAVDNVLLKGEPVGSNIVWSPVTDLYTDAAATIPYSGGALDTVYSKATSVRTYTVNATTGGVCINQDNITIQTFPDGYWNGVVSTDWSDASNWCGGVPTASTSIVIPTTADRMPTISSGSQVGNSINFNDATTLSIASGASLNVTNVIANGNTTLSGLGTLNTSGSFSFGNVDNKTFTSAGVLTLKSSATGTARIADITNGGANSGNAISGDISQERYIPAKAARKWSFLSSPFTQSIANSWQQQIHITGAGTGGTVCPTLTTNSNGFDATISNAPSVYTYNAANAQGSRWTALASTTTNVGQGVGFRVNVRGDRTLGCSLLDGTSMVPGSVVLKSTGSLGVAQKNMSSFSITYPNSGVNNYVLIGNPYPSAISFGALQTANNTIIDNKYAIYLPDNATSVYTYWDGVSGKYVGGGADMNFDNSKGDIIANGQAIFVQSSIAGDITLNFTESQKSTGTNAGYFRTPRVFNEMVKVGLSQNNHQIDEAVIRYANDAGVNNTDEGSLDIRSMNSGTYISSLKATKVMAVQTRDLRTLSNDEVWLNIGATESGTYQLNFSEFENFGVAEIFLKDHYTNTTQNIKQNDTYEFSVDKDNAATKGSARFSVVFNRTTNPVYVTNMIKMYPNPANKQVTFELPQTADNTISYSIKVTDIAGKVVMQQKANGGTHQLTIDKLTTGTYFVEVIDSKGNRTTEKLIKQ